MRSTRSVQPKSRTAVGRTTVLAVVGAVAALSATAVAPAHAAPADPLVRTGDIGKVRMGDNDTLEDVLEHISVPFGGSGTLTHQMYDSRVADAD
ncbi:hypothetical protein G5C60_26770 [Streptomyces sp. HC44]|uniref:Uncharacterized protein n=1 Tax=Streptomyces scabichelini TaxID=2711217 RepID=A0A6G4VB31_9ACTN|nr:hypothetical protein [Streptomyces scabichelini]NGO11105.1 hypothetical protein [Streptomyces scabichelini]